MRFFTYSPETGRTAMDKPVNAILDEIEQEHDCRVLFAVESGSRAWGIASPDSDYDVRFVYAHPLHWYLGLQEQRDTLERFYPGDIDCAGWEVRKALRLFAASNTAFGEWLGSPVVYRADAAIFDALKSLSIEYFNPQKALHHYLGTARGIYENHLEDGMITIKRLFYIVRPLAAGAWIARYKSIPPVPFEALLDAGVLPEAVASEVRGIRELKRTAVEGDRIRVSETVLGWVNEAFARYPEVAHELDPGEKPGWEPLNALFRRAIGASMPA
jgi:predicted nucleotidyltransferase